MNFTPAADYENLLRQARALATIVDGKEKQQSLDAKTIKALKNRIAAMSPDAVNAERETNRLLTERIDALEMYIGKNINVGLQ
jgi:uncharacterized protein YlxW (UPF0749 family)